MIKILASRNLAYNRSQLENFCSKANVTGYAKIALDALNDTVVNQTSSNVPTNFYYNSSSSKESVNLFKFKNIFSLFFYYKEKHFY
ncbi:MAG: hypothetical protein RIR51_1025 [Bacteroidota bacterium]